MAKEEKFLATDPEVLAAYKRMIAGVQGVELKGASLPYTSLNGHMFSSISKMSRIGLRLPKADREAFLGKYKTSQFEPFPGFFQKEYVAIPLEMHENTRVLRYWFRKSYAYVGSLKPKKTTR